MTETIRAKRHRSKAPIGVVHLGPGAFFRAFCAEILDMYMERTNGDWGIAAVSLRSRAICEALSKQDCTYHSMTLSSRDGPVRHVHAISRVMCAADDPLDVIEQMAEPDVRIISLTITEKGYCYDTSKGRLSFEHDDIAHDLKHPSRPKSAVGFICAALEKRMQNGAPPVTILSCDNLPSNGVVTRQVICDFARARDAQLASWIDAKVTFPSCMVDRITPATTDQDIARVKDITGFHDPACVVHEPFRQWVIEDQFASGRPELEAVGVQFVQDVRPHELMKLRCLNGTHSALAYLGYLAGFETVSRTVANPDFARFCVQLWQAEITPTVPQPCGEDLAAYCDTLLNRYRAPEIEHRVWQIAMDGSQKLPQRILDTIRDNLKRGRVPEGLCLTVAAWMQFVSGIDESGAPIDVRDPLADKLREKASAADTVSERVTALLSFEKIFGADLPQNAEFTAAVTSALDSLQNHGALQTVARLVATQNA